MVQFPGILFGSFVCLIARLPGFIMVQFPGILFGSFVCLIARLPGFISGSVSGYPFWPDQLKVTDQLPGFI
jgi:hypothetical protein